MPRPFHSSLGRPTRQDGRPVVMTSPGEAGCVVYGPYVDLDPGSYVVGFHIEPHRALFALFRPCCRVEVVCDGKAIASATVTSLRLLKRAGRVELRFTVATKGRWEFRVFSTGRLALTVQHERPVRRVPAPAPAQTGAAPANSLFATHAATFAEMGRRGVVFTVAPDRLEAAVDGVRFLIENFEDLHLLREIFFLQEYNIISPRPAIVVDIGMNIGLASLFLAGKPNVRAVHAFEPFAGPRRRAARNLDINPALAAKIVMHPFGLAGRDEERVVRVQAAGSIGMSVRGGGDGEEETIALRDAARALAPIVAEAHAQNLDLILKIDCEGSEFAIFEVLEAAGLLRAATALVVEWHKWWSDALTQHDLFRPLLDAGFVIIDRTEAADSWAGLFYAVRAAPG